MSRTLLSIGHGYTARALSRRLIPEGWTVIGTTRSPDKAEALRREGVEPLIWPGSRLPIDRVSHVLSSVAPDDDGDPVIASDGDALRAARHLVWAGYLSTTGVYGDHRGAWVDEDTPPEPSTDRGRARVRAEDGWRALGLPLHIFRLAGIYGPGRGPFEKLRRGTARRIVKQGQVFSRIHVDDIARALRLSIEAPSPGAVWNLCDDQPAPPEDVIACAAAMLGLPVPLPERIEDADLSPMARSFYAESKRVRNDRIKRDLGFSLAYPDYRSGLAAILEAEGNQP